jgi:hypothetical protein
MNPNTEHALDPASFLDDIEKRVGEIFESQKSEVEQTLIEKINREKEEAQKRIEAVNREFAQVRGFLDEHKEAMAALQSTETYLRGEIRGHFERAVNYQKMMENAAALAGDELEKIGGLNGELEKVRTKAEEEYAGLKKSLGGYAGIMARIPAPGGAVEPEVDWNEEMGKLRKVRDLLATLRQPEPSPAGETARGEETAPAAHEAEELAASLGLIGPEDDTVRDDAEFVLGAQEPEHEPAPAAAPAPASAGLDPAAAEAFPELADLAAEIEAEPAAAEPALSPEPVAAAAPDPALEALARYRRTEPVNNGIEIGFYASAAVSVLDVEAFMSAVGKVVDNAVQLHAQLSQTASVKDLFLLKQEILNQQEVLRKLFFRAVRFCDKENGRLPETLGEFLGSQGMKDLIERLTMANWSDPSDFKPFENELKALKRAFATRAAANPRYLQTVLDQVEGREN